SVDTVNQAIELCNTETLYRSDRVIGVAKWFQEVQKMFVTMKDSKKRNNLLWYAVATASQGYCHIRSSMIGTLLDDIEDGLSMRVAAARFTEKMNPDSYMRSQSTPTANSIAQAEKLVEKLGITTALERRYATYDELDKSNFIWEDRNIKYNKKEEKSESVFGNIIPKQKETPLVQNDMPATIMTWEKFKRTILTEAEAVEVKVDNSNRFMSLVTANDPEAENILQWKNPFSWYYHGGIDGEIKRRVEAAGGQYEDNEIRCSLIWNNRTDLDLHCLHCGRSEIYFGHKRSDYGYLDVDMNVNGETNEPVENIRWNKNAPYGHYKFWVNCYTDRANYKESNPFKVELEIQGQLYVFNGSVCSRKSNQVAFEFDYINGKVLNLRSDEEVITHDGSWGIATNSFVKVKGIIPSPNMWGDRPMKSFGNNIFFLLEDCKDQTEGKGRGFFNEMLKPELHEIRKTLEAFCAITPIKEKEKSDCSGVGYNENSEWSLILRVKTKNSTRLIKIDRFD
ncbi:hypothetical protein, partial [Clostridium sp.]|uniref:hypothetical protein n=1 Tax=Clostridium sp. TaxID=1506 RepID=UPI0032164A1D